MEFTNKCIIFIIFFSIKFILVYKINKKHIYKLWKKEKSYNFDSTGSKFEKLTEIDFFYKKSVSFIFNHQYAHIFKYKNFITTKYVMDILLVHPVIFFFFKICLRRWLVWLKKILAVYLWVISVHSIIKNIKNFIKSYKFLFFLRFPKCFRNSPRPHTQSPILIWFVLLFKWKYIL